MTTLTVEWEYDPEDEIQRRITATRFFVAWIGPFGDVEWTCTDEDEFRDLVEQMEE